jgi:ribosomal protein S18 acetylase RimI-like enzyme
VLNSAVVAYVEGRFDQPYSDSAWATLTKVGQGAWIFEVETDPSYRRQGWARRLVRAFVHDAQEAGSSYVALRIDPRGDQATRVAFFRSLGFEPLTGDGGPLVLGAPIQPVLYGSSGEPRT